MDKPANAGIGSRVLPMKPRTAFLPWHTLVIIVSLLVVAPMFLTALKTLSKPLIMDEMEFPAVARAIVETGMPYYYRGETLPHNTGLWHPPLYILSLAFWERIFGTTVASSRAYGLINAILAIVLIAVFAFRRLRTISPNDRASAWQYIAIGSGLLVGSTSPLLIQGSLLPDIDTQMLPLLLTVAFLILFELHIRNVRPRTYWLVYTIILSILLFAKLTTPVLLLPTFLVFEITRSLSKQIRLRWSNHLRERFRRRQNVHIVLTIGSGWVGFIGRILGILVANIAAFVLFVALWYSIAAIWGVNFNLPFRYLTQSANNPVNYSGSQSFLSVVVASAPERFGYVVQWLGYPSLLFVGLMLLREFSKPANGILVFEERMALYTFIVLLTLNYIILKPAPFLFPKYYPPLLIPLTLLSIDCLVVVSRLRGVRTVFGLFAATVGIYLVYIFANPLTSGLDFIGEYFTQWPKEPVVNTWMLYPLMAVVLVSLLSSLFLRINLLTLAAVGALAVTIGWQVNVSSIQARAPYSTTYMYGEDSLAATTDYLLANLPPGTMIIAPKDVGSRVQDQLPYIELTANPRAVMLRPQIRYLVLRTNDYYGHSVMETPEVAAVLAQEYRSLTMINNFEIFERR